MAKTFEVAFKLGAELTQSFKGAFKDANKQMNLLAAAGDRMKSTGSLLSKSVTAPLVGLGTAAILVGANFEEGMSKVAAVSGATGSDLEKLTAKARELGATTQFSATEASEALNYMAMAGWDTQQMLGGIDGVMSLAAASGEDLALVSDILTDAMTAFGMKAEESGRFADILAAASSNANTNVSMLGESFKYVAPLAGAMGYSAEDASVALSLMANAGIKGSQSGTALKTMLANLASPTKKMKGSMDKLGISLTNSDGSMKSLDEVIVNLRGSFSKLDEVQQAQYASTIFGKEAMAGALAVINASDEDYQKLTGAINNSAGAAERMAAVVNDNLKGRIKEMKSALEDSAITIYTNLQPALEAGVAAIKKLADWFNTLDSGAQNTVLVFAGVAAAVGPALVIMGTLVSSLVTVVGAFSAAKTAIMTLSVMQKLNMAIMRLHRIAMLTYTLHGGGVAGITAVMSGAFRGLTAAMMANPIGLIVTAVIALGAAFVIAYKRSETFRAIVDNSFATVKDSVLKTVGYVTEAVPQMWEQLLHDVRNIGSKVSEFLGEGMMGGLSGIIGGFIESFKTGLSSLPGILSMAAPMLTTLGLSFLGVSGPIGWIIGAVVSLAGFLFRLSKTNEGVADAFSGAWAVIQQAVEPILKVFIDGFEQFTSEVGPQLEETINVITDSFAGMGPAFAEVGASLAELGPVILSTFAEIIPVIMSIGLALFDVFKVVFPAIVAIVSTIIPIVAELLMSIVPIILMLVQTIIPLILSIIQAVFPIVLSIIQAVLPVVVSLLTTVISVILQLVQTVIPLILTVIEAVLPVVLSIIEMIIPIIVTILEVLVAIINGVLIPAINAILAVVQIVFPYIQMIIENALAIVNGIIQTAMALLTGDWDGAWNAIKATAETIMDNIINFFKNINLFETGKAVITGLIDGIKSMGTAVIGAITEMIPAPIRGAAEKIIGKFKGYADGGIVTSPELAWIGEGGDTESVIPWNNSQRSKALWVQTGKALGMMGDAGVFGTDADKSPFDLPSSAVTNNSGGQNIIQVTNKPTIVIQGDADRKDIDNALEKSNRKLLDELDEEYRDRKRVSFE